MTTIIIKNSSTSSAVPVSGDLTKGELAVNVTDKKLYTKDNGGSVVKLVGGLGNQEANAVAITGGAIDGTPIGATTASTASFTTLSASGNVTLSGGTANGVLYLNGSKVATSGSALSFDGSTLAVSNSSNNQLSLNAVSVSTGTRITFSRNGTANTYFGDAYSITGSNLDATALFTSGTNPLIFGIGSEAMRLTSTGLGIGTSSPGYKVDATVSTNGVNGYNAYGANGGAAEQIGYRAVNANNTGLFAGVNGFNYSGSFGTPNGAVITSIGNVALAFGTNNTERLRLDSSGNLGLGVTPSASSACVNMELSSYGATLSARNTSSAPQFAFMSNAVGNWYAPTYKINGKAAMYLAQGNDGSHSWYTAGTGTAGNAITFTQAMTLDASGNLLVGTTTAAGIVSVEQRGNTGVGSICSAYNHFHAGTKYADFLWYGSSIGSITNVSGTAVAYNTTSDYRLKNIDGPLTGSGAFIDALKPKVGTWKANGSKFVGFLAHEVQEVSPGSVVGEKDGEQMQAMEYGSAEFIANIIAELQSLRARVAALES